MRVDFTSTFMRREPDGSFFHLNPYAERGRWESVASIRPDPEGLHAVGQEGREPGPTPRESPEASPARARGGAGRKNVRSATRRGTLIIRISNHQ